MADLHWDDLRIFQVLAHAGTVRHAARALDIHASTVTRRLDQVERRLDVKLFHRNPGGLQITDAGRNTLARVETIADQIADLRRSVAGSDQRLAGRITAYVPTILAPLALPAIASLSHTHPGMQIELVSPSTRPDIGRGEADCAIMITDDPPQHLVGRRVGELAFAVYGTPAIAEEYDNCTVGWVDLTAFRLDFLHESFASAPIRTRCTDVSVQLTALRNGIGLGPLPCLLGDHDSGLVRVEPPRPVVAREIWLLAHPDLRSSARVREFMRFVGDAFEEAEELLLGRAGTGVERDQASP